MAKNTKINRVKRKVSLNAKKSILNGVFGKLSKEALGINITGRIAGKGLDKFDKNESHANARNSTYHMMKSGKIKNPEKLSNHYTKTRTKHTTKNGILGFGFITTWFKS